MPPPQSKPRDMGSKMLPRQSVIKDIKGEDREAIANGGRKRRAVDSSGSSRSVSRNLSKKQVRAEEANVPKTFGAKVNPLKPAGRGRGKPADLEEKKQQPSKRRKAS